jgi:hypothetical protein
MSLLIACSLEGAIGSQGRGTAERAYFTVFRPGLLLKMTQRAARVEIVYDQRPFVRMVCKLGAL